MPSADELFLTPVTSRTHLPRHDCASCPPPKRGAATAIPFGPILTLTFLVLLFIPPAAAASEEQAQNTKRQPIGSLTATGEVYVNDKPAPVESTAFVGDRVRTGAASTAIFTMAGNGTLKIGAQSQMVISGDPEFAAELQSGTTVIDSISGPTGIKVRVGDFVVIPAVRSRVTSAKIEGQAGGTFQVTCLDGDISTLPLQGGSGQLLEAGQSVSISSRGALFVQKSSGVKSAAGGGQHGPLMGRTGWTLLGLAGAGAGTAGLVLARASGGHTPVSPSAP